ncbi:MAG: hypothetical protein Q7J72_01285 [Candidatus Omnitrophota bacterium]|nr:hypothetical protein [Candidatus Omnitrophota bacterium]
MEVQPLLDNVAIPNIPSMLPQQFKYYVSQSGVLIRESDYVTEVFIDCEWVSPETSLGYQVAVDKDVAHQLIRQALKAVYDTNPEYKDKCAPGC